MSFKFLCKQKKVVISEMNTKLFKLNYRKYSLLFIGPPGVGKGTFAKIIGPQLHANVIDTGRILRKIVSSQQSSQSNHHDHNHCNENNTHNHNHHHAKTKDYLVGFTHYTNHSTEINVKTNYQSVNRAHTDACINVHNDAKCNTDSKDNTNDTNTFDHVSSETKKLIQTYMTKGELIPDDILLPIMLTHLQSSKSSIILDGFPRTLSQIKWLHDHNFHFNLAIRFHLPDHILLAKMLGRRVCQNCDNTYNVANINDMNDEKLGINLPVLTPKNANKCDKCDGNLICRSEDTVNTLQSRMSIYYQQTEPIVHFLNENNHNLLNFDIKKGIEDSNLLLSQIKEKLQYSAPVPK